MKNKRSFKSIVIQKIALKLNIKKGLSTEEGLRLRLENCKLLNSNDYILPNCTKKMNIERFIFEDMECFKLKPKELTISTSVLYLHGGAYTSGPDKLHWKMLEKICNKSKCEIILPIYPKLPQHDYRECYDKISKLYLDLKSQCKTNKLILMGDSAGGGLIAGLCLYLKKLNIELPTKLILISPWVDVSMCNENSHYIESKDIILSVYGLKEIGKLWSGEKGVYNELVSPIYGDLSQFPPTTIFAGADEILLFDIQSFHEKLIASNVDSALIVENDLGHVYCMYPFSDCKYSLDIITSKISDIYNL